jgi:hypothetical protein
MAEYITYVKGGLQALWTARKPTIAVFGPSVENSGYACSNFHGSTHNSATDNPLPPYDEHKRELGMPDTKERIEALKKLAVEKLRPGDLALVRVEDRHADGFYGYIVLPCKETIAIDLLFPETAFEYMAPMPIVPHDMVTPLLKEAILEMDELCDMGRGLGFATKKDDDTVEVNLGKYVWMHVMLNDGELLSLIDYIDCTSGSWWEPEDNSSDEE